MTTPTTTTSPKNDGFWKGQEQRGQRVFNRVSEAVVGGVKKVAFIGIGLGASAALAGVAIGVATWNVVRHPVQAAAQVKEYFSKLKSEISRSFRAKRASLIEKMGQDRSVLLAKRLEASDLSPEAKGRIAGLAASALKEVADVGSNSIQRHSGRSALFREIKGRFNLWKAYRSINRYLKLELALDAHLKKNGAYLPNEGRNLVEGLRGVVADGRVSFWEYWKTRAAIGAESLMCRWSHPTAGAIHSITPHVPVTALSVVPGPTGTP